eukprot:jgi/Phyca11/105362/e_gw1.10.546.1
MFPGIPDRLEFVAEYCLASLVYHYTYLKATLSPEHQLFETPLFQDTDLQHQLLGRVKTGDGSEQSRIRPTGIPPHVSLLCEMKWLKQGLVDALSEIESTRVATVNDIVGELEARAIGAGTVTYDGLNAAIRSCLQETGRMLTHFWGGRFRRVPADFYVPDCSTRQAWILWRCGNDAKRWPPFRLLDGRDMPDRKQQRRLSDLHSVAVESTTGQSRKRRRGQLS